MPLLHSSGTGRPRFRSAAITLVAITASGLTMLWAGGNPVGFLHGLANADFDLLLGRILGAVSWLAWAWLSVSVALEMAASLPGVAGQWAATAGRYVTPRVLRRMTQALLGASLLVGPLTAAPALAAPRSPSSSAAPAASPGVVSLDWPATSSGSIAPVAPGLLSLDRPMAGAAIGTPVTSSAPYIAPAPRPPVSTADPGPSTVLTGVAHRSSDDTGYVVRRGDALWDIAARHLGPTASAAEIARAWPRWYSANRAVIGADPSMIRPGQILFAPTRGHA